MNDNGEESISGCFRTLEGPKYRATPISVAIASRKWELNILGFIAGTQESFFEALRLERAEIAEAGGFAPASVNSGHDLQQLS